MKLINPEIITEVERPAALTGVNPRSIEGSNWWNRTREQIYRSTNYHCAACGIHKSQASHRQWLEAHESYKINFNTGIIELQNIWPLCHFCHHFIHRARLETLHTQNKINTGYYYAVLKHGFKLLNLSNLSPAIAVLHDIEWQKWKLSYKGSFYYSKFECEQQKDAYYCWLVESEQASTNANLQLFLDVWGKVKTEVSN